MKKKSLLLTAVATLGLTAVTMAQSVPSYVPTNGLVGWWPFNGNANDESGNGNNGTVNGATLTNDRFGNSNKSYSFDGVNDWIAINSLTQVSDQSDYTWSFWSNFPNNQFSGNSGLNATGAFLSCGAWWITLGHSGIPGLFYKDEQGAQGNNWYVQQYFNQFPTVDVWHHFVIKKQNNLVYFYLDGQNIGSLNSYGFTNFNSNVMIWIGRKDTNGSSYFIGQQDDFGIWNRALTQQEITDLFNGCPLSVNNQPTNQTININNTAQFVVGPSDPSVTFQWQTDLGVGFQNLNSVGQYSGTTNDTLIVSNVTLSNNNQPFRCIISSGSCSDTSNVAVLTVNNNVGINQFAPDNLFSVYPNPAQTVINVKADLKLVGEAYSVIDNTGRVVLQGKIVAEITNIELGNLSNGIYLFQVKDNFNQSFRIVKN